MIPYLLFFCTKFIYCIVYLFFLVVLYVTSGKKNNLIQFRYKSISLDFNIKIKCAVFFVLTIAKDSINTPTHIKKLQKKKYML